MSISCQKTGSWPPKGWPQFKSISHKCKQALIKDLKTARIYGLSYKIQSMPLYHLDGKYFSHDIEINGWEYTIQNDSQEYPVLSFKLLDRHDEQMGLADHISNIKVCARMIDITDQTAKRTALAGLFLMKQIGGGFVPDPARVLRVYRLLQDTPYLLQSDPGQGYMEEGFFSYKDQN